MKPSPVDIQDLYVESLVAPRDRPEGARPPLRGGQLGVPDARRVGRGLAGSPRRDGDHPVHVLPAGGRHRPRADHGRDHVRPRAPHDVPRQEAERLRHRVGARRQVRRGAQAGRVRGLEVRLRGRRPRALAAPLREVRGGGEALPRGRARPPGVRLHAEVLAHVQHPRRARRRLGDGPRRRHQARARPRRRVREGLRRVARGAGLPAAPEGARPGTGRARSRPMSEFLLEILAEEIPAGVLSRRARGPPRPRLERVRRGAPRGHAGRPLHVAPPDPRRARAWPSGSPTHARGTGPPAVRRGSTPRAGPRRPPRASRRRRASSVDDALGRPAPEGAPTSSRRRPSRGAPRRRSSPRSCRRSSRR